MLYHTGARNFECKICGNKFFQMEHLKRHMQSIHNILSNDSSHSSLTTNTSQIPKCKKSPKTQKDLSTKILNFSNINGCENVILVNGMDASVSSFIPTSSINNQNLNLDLNVNNESVQECLKITSKCMFKCQKCEFSTNKLFTLNDHVINKHIDSLSYSSQDVSTTTTELNGEELDDSFLENIDDDEEEDEDDDSQTVNSNDTKSTSQNSFSCAFCDYKAVKKLTLKVKYLLEKLFRFIKLLKCLKNK